MRVRGKTEGLDPITRVADRGPPRLWRGAQGQRSLAAVRCLSRPLPWLTLALLLLGQGPAEAAFHPGGRHRPRAGAPRASTPGASTTRAGSPRATAAPPGGAPAPATSERAQPHSALRRAYQRALKTPSAESLQRRYLELAAQAPELAQTLWAELKASSDGGSVNATLLLASLERLTLRESEAVTRLEALLMRQPAERRALALLARWAEQRRDQAALAGYLTRSIVAESGRAERLQLLRQLRAAQLELGDVPAATQTQRQLEALTPEAPQARLELARLLLERGQASEAERELASDTRKPAGAIVVQRLRLQLELSLGLAHWERAQSELAQLEREQPALAKSRPMRELALSVARGSGQLRTYYERLQQERPLALDALGDLAEELGELTQARDWRQAAVRASSRDLGRGQALLRTLEAQGRVSEALSERLRLLQLAPNQLELVTSTALALAQSGDAAKARELLTTAERRTKDSVELTALARTWETIGEPLRARALLTRLESQGGASPAASLAAKPALALAQSPIQLAEAALDRADWKAASALLTDLIERANGSPLELARLARAVERLRQAQPQEGTHWLSRESELWEAIVQSVTPGTLLELQALDQLAVVLQRRGELASRIGSLEAELAVGPQVARERLLAACLLKLGKLEAASARLQAIVQRQPEDLTSWRLLERCQLAGRRFADAATTLLRLAALIPKERGALLERALDYAEREGSLEFTRKIATSGTAMAPDSGYLWRRRAELERRLNLLDAAANSLEQASGVAHPDPLAALQLAELYEQRDQGELAFKLLLPRLAGASDRPMVEAAAQLCARVAKTSAQFVQLEGALSSLMGRFPGLRALQLETFTRELQSPDGAARLRAIAPALSGLQGTARERELALSLLETLEAPETGRPLLVFAASSAPHQERLRAVRLVTRLATPALADSLDALFWRASLETPLDEQLAWDSLVARQACKTAISAEFWQKSNRVTAPRLRAWLTLLREGEPSPQRTTPMLELALDEARSIEERAAALHALLREPSPPQTPAPQLLALAALTKQRSPLLAAYGLASLARATAGNAATEQLIANWLAGPAPFDAAARSALNHLAHPASPTPERSALPASPDALASGLEQLLQVKLNAAEREALRTLWQASVLRVAPALFEADPSLLVSLGRRAEATPKQLALSPLLPTALADQPNAEFALALRRALAPQWQRQLSSPLLAERLMALGWLAGVPEVASAALDAASRDPSALLREQALKWIAELGLVELAPRVAQALERDPEFSVRAAAAESLGQLKAPEALVLGALRTCLRQETYGWVRSRAMNALQLRGGLAAQQELSYAATMDPEPELRQLARTLRGQTR